VRSFDTHPLIVLQSQKVLQSTKRTRSTAAPISKKNTEEGMEQKKMKREHYVSTQKETNENEKQK